jgi:hypothetical protein
MRTKAFFRNFKTKLYIIIYVVLITSIILLSSFITYLEKKVNDFYETDAYISFISKYDYTSKLVSNNNIDRVEVGLVILPDFKYDTLKKIDSENNSSDINWDNYLIHDEYTSLFYISKYSDSLSKGEIILGLPFNFLSEEQKESIKLLVNKKLGFILDDDKTLEYKIKSVEDLQVDTIIISKEDYNDIYDNTTYFNTRVFVSNYKSISNIENFISNLEIEEEFGLGLSIRGDWNSNENLIFIINIINIVIYFILILTIFISILTFKNILNDHANNTFIEHVIGFKKSNIKLNIFINFSLLILISLLISMIITISIFSLFRYLNIINLNLNIVFVIKCILSFVFIDLLCCLVYKIKV